MHATDPRWLCIAEVVAESTWQDTFGYADF